MASILAALLAIGQFFVGLGYFFIACMFILGVVLSLLLVMQYKTGNHIYAMVYGGIFGLSVFMIAIVASPTGMNTEINPLSGLYGAVCSLFGISIIFSILRKRIIRFIKGEDR